MELITDEHRATMLANDQHYEDDPAFDPIPVVKVFNPLGSTTWLLCALDRSDPDIAFGLCDLGFGSPEVGSVRISEMEATVLPLGLRLERDLYFKPSKTLGEFAEDARLQGRIRAWGSICTEPSGHHSQRYWPAIAMSMP
jgi:hypothetical protein